MRGCSHPSCWPPEHRRHFFYPDCGGEDRPTQDRIGGNDGRRYRFQRPAHVTHARTRVPGAKLPRVDRDATPVGAPVPARRMDDAPRRARAPAHRAGREHRGGNRRGGRVARARTPVRRRRRAVLNARGRAERRPSS
ncbi:hypothetical protein BMAA1805 [Burkholderia mallei ATCC 23344]|uniref:Uncharacterized protein n=1 Tax=Burkholderia mallei (strain ATCC 23344) TaxID=243160 RepID=A0A0H2W9K9_BURMA|nr:hypothetical protein BMAA1805 [Burkholderia mallei ATCC 23344]